MMCGKPGCHETLVNLGENAICPRSIKDPSHGGLYSGRVGVDPPREPKVQAPRVAAALIPGAWPCRKHGCAQPATVARGKTRWCAEHEPR